MPEGDPHFRGLDGQHYDVMGEPDRHYNILSTPHFQCTCRFAKAGDFTIIDQCGMKFPGTGLFFDLAPMEEGRPVVWMNHQRVMWSASFECGLRDRKYNRLTGGIQVLHRRSVVHTCDYLVEVVWCDDHGEPHPKFGKLAAPHLDLYFYPTRDEVDSRAVPHGLLGVTARGPYTPTPGGEQGEGVLDALEPGSSYKDYEVADLWSNDFKFNQYAHH